MELSEKVVCEVCGDPADNVLTWRYKSSDVFLCNFHNKVYLTKMGKSETHTAHEIVLDGMKDNSI